jgi:hypothetical protein
MEKRVKLTMAFAEDPRLAPLKEGVVRPEHVDLEFEMIGANYLFLRNLS